jgi:hypothetical protein
VRSEPEHRQQNLVPLLAWTQAGSNKQVLSVLFPRGSTHWWHHGGLGNFLESQGKIPSPSALQLGQPSFSPSQS